jgi:hypothetical protein
LEGLTSPWTYRRGLHSWRCARPRAAPLAIRNRSDHDRLGCPERPAHAKNHVYENFISSSSILPIYCIAVKIINQEHMNQDSTFVTQKLKKFIKIYAFATVVRKKKNQDSKKHVHALIKNV